MKPTREYDSFYLFFFLRCPFSPVALYSSFAEIVTLTASLQLDIVITASFRHAILFDGTLRFIAVFANFKINRTVWLLDIQSRTTAETISRECQSLSWSRYFVFQLRELICIKSIAFSSNISVVISYTLVLVEKIRKWHENVTIQIQWGFA